MIEANNNTYSATKKLKILNFYGDSCPPCHSFMPIFLDAETRYGKYFDFVVINVANNMELSQKFSVMSTPTIIILEGEKVVFNKPGIPNGAELKQIMINLIGEDPKIETKEKKRKKFFGLF